MQQVFTSPEVRQVPHLRLIQDEARHVYNAGIPGDEVPMMTVPRPGRAITKALGISHAGLHSVICDYAAEEGECAVGYKALAEECGYTERHVYRMCRALADGGWLRIEERKAPNGKTLPNVLIPVAAGMTLGMTLGVTSMSSQEDVRDDMRDDISPLEPPVRESTNDEEQTRTPKPPRPPSGPAQEIVEAYRVAAGLPKITDYGKQVHWAQKLHEAGVTAADIPALYAYCRAWAKSADCPLMLKSVDRWRQEKDAPAIPYQNGHANRPLTDAEIDALPMPEKYERKVQRDREEFYLYHPPTLDFPPFTTVIEYRKLKRDYYQNGGR